MRDNRACNSKQYKYNTTLHPLLFFPFIFSFFRWFRFFRFFLRFRFFRRFCFCSSVLFLPPVLICSRGSMIVVGPELARIDIFYPIWPNPNI